MRFFKVLSIIALAFALGYSAPNPNNPPKLSKKQTEIIVRDNLLSQMDVFKSLFLEQNYEQTHDIVIGKLKAATDTSFDIELRENMDYFVQGFSDIYCDSFSLQLINQKDSVVARNQFAFDFPSLVFGPDRSWTYKLKINMKDCRAKKCNYSLLIMGRKSIKI